MEESFASLDVSQIDKENIITGVKFFFSLTEELIKNFFESDMCGKLTETITRVRFNFDAGFIKDTPVIWFYQLAYLQFGLARKFSSVYSFHVAKFTTIF